MIWVLLLVETLQLILRSLGINWILGQLTGASRSCIAANRTTILIKIFVAIFIWNVIIVPLLHKGVIVSIGLGEQVWIVTLMLAYIVHLISLIRITCTVTGSWINLTSIFVGIHIWLVLYTYLLFHKIDHAIFLNIRWMVSCCRRILWPLMHRHGFNCAII